MHTISQALAYREYALRERVLWTDFHTYTNINVHHVTDMDKYIV